jgi:hypothetical protein
MRSGWGIRSRMSDERGTLVMLSTVARGGAFLLFFVGNVLAPVGEHILRVCNDAQT